MDGLRGLLAIQILLVHAKYFVVFPSLLDNLTWGSYRVATFLTISGFVLYLPDAARDVVAPKRSFGEYFKRRARRLLLPWYASLILTVLLLSLMARFHLSGGLPFSQTWKSLLWHSAFLHSWNPEQRYTLNSALWLMGFEWQLSLCLPLFLALVRSKGWIALYVLAGALLVSYPGRWGYLPRFLFSAELTLPFLIGIGAARIARRPDLFFRGMKTPFIHFGLLLTCFAATLLHTLFVGAQRGTLAAHAASISIGAAIIYMTYFARCWPAQLLSHSVLRFIGRFSYSLFLLHVPLLMLFNGVCVRLDLPQSGRIYPFALLCFPLILLISYLFYCVFERPLQRTRASPDSRS